MGCVFIAAVPITKQFARGGGGNGGHVGCVGCVFITAVLVCVYYCGTYYKAVCVGVRGTVKDMCYEVRRAEAFVD